MGFKLNRFIKNVIIYLIH